MDSTNIYTAPPATPPSIPPGNNEKPIQAQPQKKFILFFLLGMLALLAMGTIIFIRIRSANKPAAVQPTGIPTQITPTPIQTTASNKIVFLSKVHGLASANPDGTNIKPYNITIIKTNGGAAVSPDNSKVVFTGIEYQELTPVSISHEIINLSDNSTRKIDLDKIRASAGNYKFILFHEWLPDNVSLLFQATNTLAEDPGNRDQYVGIYNTKTFEIKKVFTKNGKYLGNFKYDGVKQIITYYEGWGSGEVSINDFDMKTGTHSQATITAEEQAREKTFETIKSLTPPGITTQELVWSEDGSHIVVLSEKAGNDPFTNLAIHTKDGKLVSSTDVSDYNKTANTIHPNDTPQGGIFSPDNNYFLYHSVATTDPFRKTSWLVVEVQTGKIISEKITSESLGTPILWIN